MLCCQKPSTSAKRDTTLASVQRFLFVLPTPSRYDRVCFHSAYSYEFLCHGKHGFCSFREGHKHLLLQGNLTQQSARYPPRLVAFIGNSFFFFWRRFWRTHYEFTLRLRRQTSRDSALASSSPRKKGYTQHFLFFDFLFFLLFYFPHFDFAFLTFLKKKKNFLTFEICSSFSFCVFRFFLKFLSCFYLFFEKKLYVLLFSFLQAISIQDMLRIWSPSRHGWLIRWEKGWT